MFLHQPAAAVPALVCCASSPLVVAMAGADRCRLLLALLLARAAAPRLRSRSCARGNAWQMSELVAYLVFDLMGPVGDVSCVRIGAAACADALACACDSERAGRRAPEAVPRFATTTRNQPGSEQQTRSRSAIAQLLGNLQIARCDLRQSGRTRKIRRAGAHAIRGFSASVVTAGSPPPVSHRRGRGCFET
jgi:hypothetical protein